MKRTLAEAIVDFLSLSETTSDRLSVLRGFDRHAWEHTFTWLHDAGLALYLLQKLKDTHVTNILPRSTLSRLEENLAANRRRVAYMATQFDFLNQKLNGAGVRYVVVKGVSLVPQFCPDPCLRHQSDFDYLVDHQSLPVAQRVLEDAGYRLKESSASQLGFLMPSARTPRLADEQYEAHAPYSVELHLSFWDSDYHGVFLTEPEFSTDNISTHRWQELVFRVLPEEEVFLLQVIHAFNHILFGWIRMSWLYEIGYFLNQRVADTVLWERIERRIGGDPLLREIVAVVTKLSADLFGAPFPSTLRIWAEELRPAVRIWIQHYARIWVFGKYRVDRFNLFPPARLALFLRLQYVPDAGARKHLVRAILPSRRLSRIARSIKDQPSTSLSERWRKRERIFHGLLSYGTTTLRYLWEIPRWRRLNKMIVQLAPANRHDLPATEPIRAQSTKSM